MDRRCLRCCRSSGGWARLHTTGAVSWSTCRPWKACGDARVLPVGGRFGSRGRPPAVDRRDGSGNGPVQRRLRGVDDLTAQQWHDLLTMIDRPDLIGDGSSTAPAPHFPGGGVAPVIDEWTNSARWQRSSNEQPCSRTCRAVLNGASLPQFEPLTERGLFARNPAAGSHTRAGRSGVRRPSLAQ